MSALAEHLENELRERFRRGSNLVVWLDAEGGGTRPHELRRDVVLGAQASCLLFVPKGRS